MICRKSTDEIDAIGHRVLHGGEKFTRSVVIDDAVMDAIRENIPLGPLHNPANLMGIEACQKVMPGTPMVAVFDTAFHQTMPPKAFMYGVPMKYYTNLHVRRYGFHGTSHRYVSARAAEFLAASAWTPAWVSPRWRASSWVPAAAAWIPPCCSSL